MAKRHNPVHPRTGGEHRLHDGGAASGGGSSPHGRGTPPRTMSRVECHRFIPARAGNTRGSPRRRPGRPVHPRTGGEHLHCESPATTPVGSSPHGRGTPARGSATARHGRFIPARAGNTTAMHGIPNFPSVHPRTGGEHAVEGYILGDDFGSSPHGRGTQGQRGTTRHGPRFIPARAGNTRSLPARLTATAVHPRTGGEHSILAGPPDGNCGSSPHGRGTRHSISRLICRSRFIPARAGNTPPESARTPPTPVHPRTGGEHSRKVLLEVEHDGSSPHGRGTLTTPKWPIVGIRFIPARAGNTTCRLPLRMRHTVHPRTGGEHKYIHRPCGMSAGSSPHGRGTPR